MSDDVDMKDAAADNLQDTEINVDNEIVPESEVKEKEQAMEKQNEDSEMKNDDNDEDMYKEPVPPPQPSLLRKDKNLKEFLQEIDDYAPIIPDAVTDYYLAKSGFETSDRRIKRLLALATQKFVSDVASDAYQYSRIRSTSSVAAAQNPQARARALASGQAAAAAAAAAAAGSTNAQSSNTGGGGGGGGGGSSSNQGKLVLTMEDLGNALAEYGLNVKRPDFYR